MFPYLGPLDGKPHPTLMRIRYLGGLPCDNTGKEVRYTQPSGLGVEVFFDANINWLEVMRDPGVSIAITEGKAKTLYMNYHRKELGEIVTVALGCVWNFREKATGTLRRGFGGCPRRVAGKVANSSSPGDVWRRW